MTDPEHVLRERFGFPGFRPGQREVIDALLAGRSAAAIFPTGSGKSLCYQLPALMLPGLTLVVSPLIALMKDQIDALARRGIMATRLDSSLTLEEHRAATDALRDGSMRLLYVAPERFNNERFRQSLGRCRVSLFAIDEAHCISEWGHNFRPDYLKLARFARRLEAERVLALTATATPAVVEDMRRVFEIAPADAVRTGFYRPNLELLPTVVEPGERDARLLARLRERPRGPTLVYVTQQRTAERVAEDLTRAGFDAQAYHAGMDPERRARTQERFLASRDGVVVATIAFGMGVDKADIRYVYHYNLPKSLENLAQEIGRAGRDGEPAVCEQLVCADDLDVLESFVYGDTPTDEAIAGFLSEVLGGEASFDVSVRELASRHDVRDTVVRTLLTYLELDGLIEGGTPLYSVYRFKPLRSSQEMLAELPEAERPFARALLARSKKARLWFSIDLHEAAVALGVPRGRAVAALDDMAARQFIELQATGVRLRYRRLRDGVDLDAVACSLAERMQHREQRELDRLAQVLSLATTEGCQVAALGAHFGEVMAGDCGHCARCLGVPARPLSERQVPDVDPVTWARLLDVRAAHTVLAAPRAFARFACGVGSPALTRQKLTRDPGFGALSHVPFPEVMARAAGSQ